MADDWESRLGALGSAIRHQRQLAKMSLRQLSVLAQVSNPEGGHDLAPQAGDAHL